MINVEGGDYFWLERRPWGFSVALADADEVSLPIAIIRGSQCLSIAYHDFQSDDKILVQLNPCFLQAWHDICIRGHTSEGECSLASLLKAAKVRQLVPTLHMTY